MPKMNKHPNTQCAYCGKALFRWPYMMKRSKVFLCDCKCRSKWMIENLQGANGYNWREGSWNNRVQVLAHTSYRTWRNGILEGKGCIFCDSMNKLELHHIVSKIIAPERVKDPTNVLVICASCHDVLHSNSSKGGELREHLNAILAQGNPQPSLPNAQIYVGRKVQRLMGEDAKANKPDTSAAPERDEIVRAWSKDQEAELKSKAITNCIVDSSMMKEYLIWFNRIPVEFDSTTDFDTKMRKYADYFRVGWGFTDWRWIIGSFVA